MPALKDRKLKLSLYGRLGVLHAWLVDPRAKSFEVLRYENERWTLLGTFGDQEACVPNLSRQWLWRCSISGLGN